MLRIEEEDLLRYLLIKSEVSKKRKARKAVDKKEEVKIEERPKVTVVTKTSNKDKKVSEVAKVTKVIKVKKGKKK